MIIFQQVTAYQIGTIIEALQFSEVFYGAIRTIFDFVWNF